MPNQAVLVCHSTDGVTPLVARWWPPSTHACELRQYRGLGPTLEQVEGVRGGSCWCTGAVERLPPGRFVACMF